VGIEATCERAEISYAPVDAGIIESASIGRKKEGPEDPRGLGITVEVDDRRGTVGKEVA